MNRERIDSMVCAKISKIVTVMTTSCLSPKELAKKSGVSANTIYRIRKGYMVKMELLGKVCRALEVKPEDVIDYDRLERGEKECN